MTIVGSDSVDKPPNDNTEKQFLVTAATSTISNDGNSSSQAPWLRSTHLLGFLVLIPSIWISNICLWSEKRILLCHSSPFSLVSLAQWTVAQVSMPSLMAQRLQQSSWDCWEGNSQKVGNSAFLSSNDADGVVAFPDVPALDLREWESRHLDENPALVLNELNARFGHDWRKRPLILKGLWTEEELGDPSRRLSLNGLLREHDIEIGYFRNSSIQGAIWPDARGSVADIVYNISKRQLPHKIGTQRIVQEHPRLFLEVAKPNLLTKLFGNFFQEKHVRLLLGGLLKGSFTTVPLFVANGGAALKSGGSHRPRTELHCEPIGNVAVQLEGSKSWTILSPDHSFQLRPSLDVKGRAFIFSRIQDPQKWRHLHPYQTVVTEPGDALWIPTWTWHRVDYTANATSIEASIFHFRPLDFLRNNPLFALMVVPAMIKETLGINAA